MREVKFKIKYDVKEARSVGNPLPSKPIILAIAYRDVHRIILAHR